MEKKPGTLSGFMTAICTISSVYTLGLMICCRNIQKMGYKCTHCMRDCHKIYVSHVSTSGFKTGYTIDPI
jgi:hypothetical protein